MHKFHLESISVTKVLVCKIFNPKCKIYIFFILYLISYDCLILKYLIHMYFLSLNFLHLIEILLSIYT